MAVAILDSCREREMNHLVCLHLVDKEETRDHYTVDYLQSSHARAGLVDLHKGIAEVNMMVGRHCE